MNRKPQRPADFSALNEFSMVVLAVFFFGLAAAVLPRLNAVPALAGATPSPMPPNTAAPTRPLRITLTIPTWTPTPSLTPTRRATTTAAPAPPVFTRVPGTETAALTPLPGPTASQTPVPDLFTESFDGAELDPRRWETARLRQPGANYNTGYRLSGGRLHFFADPLPGPWLDSLIEARLPWADQGADQGADQAAGRLTGASISRIRMTFQMETPMQDRPGWFIVQTPCQEGSFELRLVGSRLKDDGSRAHEIVGRLSRGGQVQEFNYGPLADNLPHTLELRQQQGQVTVWLDGQARAEMSGRAAGCRWLRFDGLPLRFGIGMNAGNQVQGWIDAVEVQR